MYDCVTSLSAWSNHFSWARFCSNLSARFTNAPEGPDTSILKLLSCLRHFFSFYSFDFVHFLFQCSRFFGDVPLQKYWREWFWAVLYSSVSSRFGKFSGAECFARCFSIELSDWRSNFENDGITPSFNKRRIFDALEFKKNAFKLFLFVIASQMYSNYNLRQTSLEKQFHQPKPSLKKLFGDWKLSVCSSMGQTWTS